MPDVRLPTLLGEPRTGTAVLVHPAVGYTDPFHLSPAVGGAGLFAAGWWLVRP